ncbi:hypothetical protein WJ0W_005151 [Paenibacillus melissococcoides]|uniref:Uncharacterized protein n=1 Tax=Paenibacillus melissococcoides TaxID=2912268 RepID=A0ABM9G7J6_9BACL|nr:MULTISPECIES: hypothetical protein [Paenibacillus]MEB9892559.1 hypothetical protein [Bacillus cereus]CAH8247896.1 hypothetical protein WJ0W_005151 [Paenibacillus melissococcoides]CAH8719219.1 hypothetical protein HTL2_005538 [Paenibacillus melissococcoides]CAH8720230.1 hypothetical protein WDD9_005812 [Paenibacillus melissococcoides]GIO78818.1 hypothetical protein J6TS7_24280 [Paenibacillus dendritiformis]
MTESISFAATGDSLIALPFGAYLFTGEHEGASCRLHQGDVDRIVRSIREAEDRRIMSS